MVQVSILFTAHFSFIHALQWKLVCYHSRPRCVCSRPFVCCVNQQHISGEGALRASSTANPPYNMNNALILHGTVVMVFGVVVFFVRARQARRELDETMAAENAVPMIPYRDTAGKLEGTREELVLMKDFS